MAVRDYLQPANAGNQMWQVLASNLTRGPHPYNFKGFCMTLVVQWLLEIHAEPGATPEALGRHLLNADLGAHGYRDIALSHHIYDSLNPGLGVNEGIFRRHSGGTLRREQSLSANSAQNHWRIIRAGIYGESLEDGPPVNAARRYSAHISLSGPNSWILRRLSGDTWGHTIGLYSDGHRVYFFDPNYGVFVFGQANRQAMANFIRDLWTEYGATEGRRARITRDAVPGY